MTWLKNLWFKLLKIIKGDNNISLPQKDVTLYQLINSTNRLSNEAVKEFNIYHVGSGEWKWLLMFRCPCGCGDVIQLSLLEKSKQSWKIEIENDKQFSIYPSIDRIVGCKSHFFIKKNKVEWCSLSELNYEE